MSHACEYIYIYIYMYNTDSSETTRIISLRTRAHIQYHILFKISMNSAIDINTRLIHR
jgi:hypothetical protein